MAEILLLISFNRCNCLIKKNSVPNGGATLLFEGYLSLHFIGQNLKSQEGVAESKVEGMLLASRYWDAGEYNNADMKSNIFLVISLNMGDALHNTVYHMLVIINDHFYMNEPVYKSLPKNAILRIEEWEYYMNIWISWKSLIVQPRV